MITMRVKNYRKLIRLLDELVEDLDFDKSRRGVKNTVTMKDGTNLRGGNFRGLLKAINRYLGKEYFIVNRSRPLAGGTYCIRVNEEPVELDTVEETPVVEDEVVTEPTEETVQEEEVVETEEVEEQEIVEEDSDTKGVDWDFVNSLKNNKPDKVKLDKYAEDFGVKLNQRNTLENMIKMFKEELEKQ